MGRRAEVAAGFTLLELVVALALLAVALAVVTPAIGRGTESLRARAEVAGFAATLRHAREQAITSQRSRRVVIDREAHRVTVITPPDP
jgi:general secretion pathway protein H